MLENLLDFIRSPVRVFGSAAYSVPHSLSRGVSRRVNGDSKGESSTTRRDFAATAFLRFAYWVCAGWMWIFFPLFFVSTGFSLVESGVLVTAFILPRVLSNGPFGVLTDFKSPKRVALVGMVLTMTGFTLLSALSYSTNSSKASFETILLIILLLGFATSIAETASTSLAFKRVSAARRGRDIGVIEFLKYLGIGIAVLAAGVVFSFVGYATGFAFFAVCCAFVSIAWLLFVRDYRGAVAERVYWRAFASREILLLLAVMFLVSFHFGVENSTMSVYMKRAVGLNDAGIGLFFGVGITAYAVFNYLSGRRIDRASKHKSVFLLGLTLSAIGFACLGCTTNFALALGARMVHELGDALVILYALYVLLRVGGAQRIGGLQGFYLTVVTLGSAAGSFSAGFIASAIGGNAGLSASFVIASLFTLAGGALLLFANSGSLFHAAKNTSHN
ncbi:MAG: MFS transporter [Candidatus Norongarragalinales archaeon]